MIEDLIEFPSTHLALKSKSERMLGSRPKKKFEACLTPDELVEHIIDLGGRAAMWSYKVAKALSRHPKNAPFAGVLAKYVHEGHRTALFLLGVGFGLSLGDHVSPANAEEAHKIVRGYLDDCGWLPMLNGCDRHVGRISQWLRSE